MRDKDQPVEPLSAEYSRGWNEAMDWAARIADALAASARLAAQELTGAELRAVLAQPVARVAAPSDGLDIRQLLRAMNTVLGGHVTGKMAADVAREYVGFGECPHCHNAYREGHAFDCPVVLADRAALATTGQPETGYAPTFRKEGDWTREEGMAPSIEDTRTADPGGLREAVVAYLDHMDKREPYADVHADIVQAGSGGPDFTTDRHFDGDGCFAAMERAALTPEATAPEPDDVR